MPRLSATLREGTGAYGPLSLTRDGRYLATGSSDGKVCLWDLTDRSHPVETTEFTGLRAAVGSAAFAPGGGRPTSTR